MTNPLEQKLSLADQSTSYQQTAVMLQEKSMEYLVGSVKSVGVMNGAAVIAILALIGQLFNKHQSLATALLIPATFFIISLVMTFNIFGGLIREIQAQAKGYQEYAQKLMMESVCSPEELEEIRKKEAENAAKNTPQEVSFLKKKWQGLGAKLTSQTVRSKIMASSFYSGIFSIIIIFSLYASSYWKPLVKLIQI